MFVGFFDMLKRQDGPVNAIPKDGGLDVLNGVGNSIAEVQEPDIDNHPVYGISLVYDNGFASRLIQVINSSSGSTESERRNRTSLDSM